MTICLLIIDDGREDFAERARHDAGRYIGPVFDQYLLIDDSDHRLGFAGAVQAGWELVQTNYCLHLESDFTFNEMVDVDGMIALLERQPHLAQVSLKRQAVNEHESAAGGIVECHPDDFTERSDHAATWTEHRRYWTTNPSIYSSRYCRMGWPQQPRSEGVFTHRLLRDPLLHFAIWGAKFDAPRVHHRGVRAGHGY